MALALRTMVIPTAANDTLYRCVLLQQNPAEHRSRRQHVACVLAVRKAPCVGRLGACSAVRCYNNQQRCRCAAQDACLPPGLSLESRATLNNPGQAHCGAALASPLKAPPSMYSNVQFNTLPRFQPHHSDSWCSYGGDKPRREWMVHLQVRLQGSVRACSGLCDTFRESPACPRGQPELRRWLLPAGAAACRRPADAPSSPPPPTPAGGRRPGGRLRARERVGGDCKQVCCAGSGH